MVLVGIWQEHRIRKATAAADEKARRETREEAMETLRIHHDRWEAWRQRLQNAHNQGLPFDEPPPQMHDQTEPPR